MDDLPDEARFAAALASLGAGPRRLRAFLDGYAPQQAWEALAAGKHREDPDRVYRSKASPAPSSPRRRPSKTSAASTGTHIC